MSRSVDRLLAVGLGLGIVWCAGRYVDLAWYPLAVAQSLVPMVGLGILVLTALAGATGRERTARVGLLACLVLGGIGLPHVWPGRTVAAAPDDLVVMSANLEYGEGDPGRIVELVREHEVDLLVLLEVMTGREGGLAAAGLSAELPYAVGRADDIGAGGTVIRSRYPLRELPSATAAQASREFRQPVAAVAIPGRAEILVRAVHPLPPASPTMTGSWRRGLATLADWVAAAPPDTVLVLAGDFNASADHPAYRIVADGLVDAHREAGKGLVTTWPRETRIPPFVQLDHVLARGLAVVDAGSDPVPGSDHAAVWARWSLTHTN